MNAMVHAVRSQLVLGQQALDTEALKQLGSFHTELVSIGANQTNSNDFSRPSFFPQILNALSLPVRSRF